MNPRGTGSGLFVRRHLMILGVIALCGVLVFSVGVHDFLTITRPVDGNVLVVEAWIKDSPAVMEAAAEFRRGQYERLVTVGELAGNGNRDHDWSSSAEPIARRLREAGVDENRIVALPMSDVKRHHTFASALALKEWLNGTDVRVTGINVFTIGAHARKSLVLFRRALGSRVRVGVIAGTEHSYDVRRWWLSPRGVYVVARKTLGYLYAVFWPFPNADAAHASESISAHHSMA
jgi:hypothetical protein